MTRPNVAVRREQLLSHIPAKTLESRVHHVGLRGVDYTMFRDWRGRVPLGETVACCDFGSDHKNMLTNGTRRVISLEQARGFHADWSVDDINDIPRLPGFQELLADRARNPVVLLPFKNTPALEELNDRNVTVAAPSADLVRFLDDKTNLARVLETQGITPIPSRNVSRAELTPELFAEIQREYGTRLVAQIPHGCGGSGTFFVNTFDETAQIYARYGTDVLKIAKYIDGPSLNGQACIMETTQGLKSIVFTPSFQIIGVPELTGWPSYYCGNDYTGTLGTLGAGGIASYKDVMEKIGAYAGERGFRGVFGIDFIFNPEEQRVYVVEINPRLQASSSCLHMLMEGQGLIGVGTYHMVAQLADRPFPLELVQQHMVELQGSHVLVNNKSGSDVVVRGNVDPGVYHANGGLHQVERLYWMTPGDGEFLVTCGVPESGTRVQGNGTILKIYSTMQALNDTFNGLTAPMQNVVAHVYDALRLE